jgi:hypothetical protein
MARKISGTDFLIFCGSRALDPSKMGRRFPVSSIKCPCTGYLRAFSRAPEIELQAIWLDTARGFDWSRENEETPGWLPRSLCLRNLRTDELEDTA